VGTVLNVVSSIARVNLDTVIKGMLPFMIAETLVMFLLVLFPQWSWSRRAGSIERAVNWSTKCFLSLLLGQWGPAFPKECGPRCQML
jgi:hypothetical protein